MRGGLAWQRPKAGLAPKKPPEHVAFGPVHAQGRRPSPWAAGWARQRGAPQPSSAPTTPTDEEGPRSERTSPASSAARHSGVGALARGPLQLLLRRPAMR